MDYFCFFFFFQAEDGIRDLYVTGVQTCALPIWRSHHSADAGGGNGRGLGPRSAGRLGTAGSPDRRAARQRRRAVLRPSAAPGHPRRGVHGADEGLSRVPRGSGHTGGDKMMTTSSYRSARPVGHDGFGRLLWAEWTKLRTVRGWVLAVILAAALTAAVPIFLASSAKADGAQTCAHRVCQVEGQTIATGPEGGGVIDNFYFAHQPLAADGSITARVSRLHGTGRMAIPPGFPSAPSTMPWAKAGLMIKAGTTPGSAYAAVMQTGAHGVRMQYDFTDDVAGSSASAQWLRLTRSGDSVTGYESADGRHWTEIGTAVLPALTGTAQAGLFIASPTYQTAIGSGDNSVGAGTQA